MTLLPLGAGSGKACKLFSVSLWSLRACNLTLTRRVPELGPLRFPSCYRTASTTIQSRSFSIREGLRTRLLNKTIGQHVLEATHIVDRIVDEADIKSTDTVFEIGPGTGNVTMKLLEKAKRVIAIEYDPRMVHAAKARAEKAGLGHKLLVIHGDVLRVPWPPFDVMVANLPYQISSPFMRKLLEPEGSLNDNASPGRNPQMRKQFRSALLMFQDEFAMRLLAREGTQTYSRLSVTTRLLADVDNVMQVHRRNFRPPPRVESRIVRVTPKEAPADIDVKEFEAMLRLCFLRKNKTLRAVFSSDNIVSQLERLSDVVPHEELHLSRDLQGPLHNVSIILGDGKNNGCYPTTGCAVKNAESLSENDEIVTQPRNHSTKARRRRVGQSERDTKTTVLKLLAANNWSDQRVVKMSSADLARFYRAFKNAGLRFK